MKFKGTTVKPKMLALGKRGRESIPKDAGEVSDPGHDEWKKVYIQNGIREQRWRAAMVRFAKASTTVG